LKDVNAMRADFKKEKRKYGQIAEAKGI